MLYLTVSIAAFCLTLTAHVIIYRLFKKIDADILIAFLTFAVGFILAGSLVYFIFRQYQINNAGDNLWLRPLPLTAVVVYLLLSVAYLIFFLAPYLGEDSPTSTILIMLKKNNRRTFGQIRTKFTNQKLIGLRLVKFIDGGYVRKHHNKYFILPKGKLVATIINFYRQILGWNTFG